jgi:hypothetical protein
LLGIGHRVRGLPRPPSASGPLARLLQLGRG